jgi:hypothetical protein
MRSLIALTAVLVFAGVAGATAPPVKKIPTGPTSTISTKKGQLVSVALPHRVGKSWRLARNVDAKVLREVSEADVGNSVVIVFRAYGLGTTKVVYALTRGESPTASASATYTVTVR